MPRSELGGDGREDKNLGVNPLQSVNRGSITECRTFHTAVQVKILHNVSPIDCFHILLIYVTGRTG